MTQTTRGYLNGLSSFQGIDIISSPLAIKTVWNFKESKHRSGRLHKKLYRKFGCQSFEKPAAYMVSGKLVANPAIIEQMMKDNRVVKVAEMENDFIKVCHDR